MPARRKSGFTLIELLVVIAIIAILAAILFPVFARAREAARKSNCQNNMKQCAIALQSYWNDYDGTLPSSNVGYSNSSAGTLIQNTPGNFCVGFTASYKPGNPPAGSWASYLDPYMKNKDVIWCPSDSGKDGGKDLSYWWKYALDYYALKGTTSGVMKESDCGYPADQIAFFERASFHSGDTRGLVTNASSSSQINVAYLDSHVKTLTLKDGPTSKFTTENITSEPSSFPTNEPFYFNYCNDDGNGNVKDVKNTASYDPRFYSDKL